MASLHSPAFDGWKLKFRPGTVATSLAKGSVSALITIIANNETMNISVSLLVTFTTRTAASASKHVVDVDSCRLQVQGHDDPSESETCRAVLYLPLMT